jgi:hypothetical protein
MLPHSRILVSPVSAVGLALSISDLFYAFVNHLALFKVGLDVARASTPTLKTAGYAGYLDV